MPLRPYAFWAEQRYAPTTMSLRFAAYTTNMSDERNKTPAKGRRYRCSTCGRDVEYDGGLPELFPFCSSRCRLVDLGKWLLEEYSIDRDLTPEDLGNPDVAKHLPPE